MTNPLHLPTSAAVAALLLIAAEHAQAQPFNLQHERTPTVSAFPEYPEDARRERLEGEATVCFTIDAAGSVNRPRIQSSTARVFEKPTLRAIKESSFEPLAAGQLLSSVSVCRTYRYKLDQLDPLYVAREPAEPQIAPADSVASLAADSLSADPAAFEQGSVEPTTASAPAPAQGETLITEATPLPPEEPLCSTGKRAGTRIEYTFCYSPQEQVMMEEQKRRVRDDLQIEERWRDQAIMDAKIMNTFPKGAGMGPNN